MAGGRPCRLFAASVSRACDRRGVIAAPARLSLMHSLADDQTGLLHGQVCFLGPKPTKPMGSLPWTTRKYSSATFAAIIVHFRSSRWVQ